MYFNLLEYCTRINVPMTIDLSGRGEGDREIINFGSVLVLRRDVSPSDVRAVWLLYIGHGAAERAWLDVTVM